MDGTIDFFQDPWGAMPDGLSKSGRCSVPLPNAPFAPGLTLPAQALVARLLIYSPFHRSTVYQALQSAWITEGLTELENAYQERIISG